jgi:hypothetical protein
MPVRHAPHRHWVRLGALTRLNEIENEYADILRAFPDFRKGRRAAGLGSGHPARRRKISAAARRAMRAGMRKYWARRRAEAAKRQRKSKGEASE